MWTISAEAPGLFLHDLPDAAATLALGQSLVDYLAPGVAVLLYGDLGAGKTTLARGLIRAFVERADEDVPSPTFTLMQGYEGPRGLLWHLDLYRIARAQELEELGIEALFAEGCVIIEWPQRLSDPLPRDHLAIRLTPRGEGRIAELRLGGAVIPPPHREIPAKPD